ncbi:MAG: hypothetical protein ABJB34_12850, partial [Acidobacteriota bacterium]
MPQTCADSRLRMSGFPFDILTDDRHAGFGMMVVMKAHLTLLVFLIVLSLPGRSAAAPEFFYLGQEPLVRIGLTTDASSISITTSDTQLVAYSLDEPTKYLATNRVSVSARAYRPPEVENYRFE